MRNAASARLLKLKTERQREAAPLPFDLGTLQEVCSKKLGLALRKPSHRATTTAAHRRGGAGHRRGADSSRPDARGAAAASGPVAPLAGVE